MKFRYIDALRGIAILLVMMVHTSHYRTLSANSDLISFFSFGAKGVQLFFLLSAFTLFNSYNNTHTTDTNTVRNFYIRRLFRIAPLYYLGILYYSWCNHNWDTTQIWNILSNVFFIHGVSPYWINNIVPGGWSITVEMVFYIFLPILVRYIKTLNQALLFTILSYVLSMIIRVLLIKFVLIDDVKLWKEFSYYNFFTQLPAFGFGIIGYYLIIKKDFRVSPITLLMVTGILFGQFLFGGIIPNFILFCICFLLLTYILSIKEYVFFVNRFTVFLGRVSFSAYLTHFAVLYWIEKAQVVEFLVNTHSKYAYVLSFSLRFAIMIMITAAISFLLYRLIEIPFIGFGQKLISRQNKLRLV